MTQFRLYLWREWRQHRGALLALALVLPLATALVAWPLAKGHVRDPYFHAVVAGGFALALLAVVGGELLGGERRGPVHGWLERLPGGLESAFRAKLVFFGLTLVGATAAGFATAAGVAFLRAAPARGFEPWLVCAGIAALGAWTFAASAWTQRGGLAVMAAALVLCLVGYPVWRVVTLGYTPRNEEWFLLGIWLVPGALLGAALAYVRGTSHGRASGWAALLGVAPALPLVVGAFLWSEERLAERERFEPTAQDFTLYGAHLSRDGRFVLAIGEHRVPRWGDLPQRIVRIELATGAVERLGNFQDMHTLAYEQADGLPADEDVVVPLAEGRQRIFSLVDGSLREERRKPRDVVWHAQGLGARLWTPEDWLFRDPFRTREYRRDSMPKELRSQVLIRPGRWLVAAYGEDWRWFDPDTGAQEPVAWPAGARPLVVLPDGGVLVRDGAELRLEHPERGSARVVDTHGILVSTLLYDTRGRRLWGADLIPWLDEGPIVLQSSARECAVLVIDPTSGASRRIDPGEPLQPIGRLGPEALLVTRWQKSSRLARFELADGSLHDVGGRR